MAKMLTDLGHEVFFYGSEGSDVEEYCNSDNLHFIQTHTLDDIRRDYGVGDNRYELGYAWNTMDFKHDLSDDVVKPSTVKFYANCIKNINSVKKPDDFLLISQGRYQEPIRKSVGLFLNCEFGIGYRGSVSSNWRAFESSYIQNYTYGGENGLKCASGSHYDRVIPNYFDANDIEYSDKKGDYYLFIGRIIGRKGVAIAVETCKHIGKKLIIVGQGAKLVNGDLIDNAPHEVTIKKGYLDFEYLGFADVNKRKELMANAIATFTPTTYLECFAGTHVESMLSGTPPITTNFGVFPETIPSVLDGIVGFRCNTLDDFVEASLKARYVDHKKIRSYAERFLMGNVTKEFIRWFDDLYNIWESSVDSTKQGFNRVYKRV